MINKRYVTVTAMQWRACTIDIHFHDVSAIQVATPQAVAKYVIPLHPPAIFTKRMKGCWTSDRKDTDLSRNRLKKKKKKMGIQTNIYWVRTDNAIEQNAHCCM